jgi:leucyl aminopeptidase
VSSLTVLYAALAVAVTTPGQAHSDGAPCAQCSDSDPKFIHLKYSSGSPKRKLALVGKGITFDAGGYNIKAGPGSMIELMKFDMGGAAAVLGAARALAAIAPADMEVHFISAACENLISGAGLLPGDVLVAANGKTVEVANTDAEGRLTLADALWYAQEKVGAERCIDIATLTGSQIIALGTAIGAVMAPADEASDAVVAAGRCTGGERWWRLPLEESYMEMLKSKTADLVNVGGRPAGTITAGLFLKQFVDSEKMQWAHLDIAGPCWNEKLGGATGFGAATLAHWAESQAK